jgi:hypothetical protein
MLTIFNKAVTTNLGRALLAESVATETPLQFTAMVTGSGSYTDEEKTVAALEVMTALKSQKQSFPISHLSRTTPYEAVVKSVLTNTGLSTPYVWNEVGLYAKLEDSADDPVLYSIAVVASSEGTEIPAYSSTTALNVVQSFYLLVNNSANVSILINDSFEMLDDAGFNDDLTTSEKGTLVGAINELDGEIGDLTNLTTTEKSNVVGAVNELDGKIGLLSSLATTIKTSIVAAINEIVTKITNKVLYYEDVACSATTGDFATITNSAITADHVVVDCVFANPSAITTDVTCTTSAGSAVLNGTCTTATTATITLIKKDN